MNFCRRRSSPTFLTNDYFYSRLMELGERVHLCIVEAKNDIAAACLFFRIGWDRTSPSGGHALALS